MVDLWNEDGGTSSEWAYKNVPFSQPRLWRLDQPPGARLARGGLGGPTFRVGIERVRFSVPGESLEYFLIYGPTPKEVLSRYTALTGRPALPPPWSFGLWLTTSFTTDYDKETVTHFVDGMAERDIPLHVFHLNCFWMKEFHWCNFERHGYLSLPLMVRPTNGIETRR